MSYVNGEQTYEQSIYPYMGYSANGEWAAAIYDDTVPQIINIPSIYKDYTFVSDRNIHEIDYVGPELNNRIIKVGSTQDTATANYHLEDHRIVGKGLAFVKLPQEADGATITHNKAANGNIRLVYLDDDILSYDFSDFGDFQNLGMFSHEIGLPAGGNSASHIIEVITYTGVPSHHFVEGVDFNASVTSIGMNDLHLCDSEGIRHATVLETVEYEQTLPHGFGIFERVGEVFKISRFYEDSGAKNYEQSQKAGKGIRDQFNALKGDPYNRARTSIEILDGQDPDYDGDLTYCRNGVGNGGEGYMITHPFEQTNKVTISYEFTPQVLDSNSLPVGTLEQWLANFQRVESGDQIFGVTQNTYLVVESGEQSSQLRIRYDNRAGHVESVATGPAMQIDVIGHRALGGSSVSLSDGNMEVSGTGRVLVQLDNTNLQAIQDGILLNLNLSGGTTVRMVQSPYDLINMEHNPERGFVIGNFRHNSGFNPINVLAGTLEDSIKVATYSYDRNAEYRVHHGKCCKGAYTTYGSDTISGSTSNFRETFNDGYVEITKVNQAWSSLEWEDVAAHGQQWMRDGPNTVDNFRYTIYDMLPAKGDQRSYDMIGEADIPVPAGDDAYLVIDSNGGTSTIGLQITPQSNMTISNLELAINSTKNPGGIPYYIEQGGVGIKSGIAKPAGSGKISLTIDTGLFPESVGSGAKLYLYHNALMKNINSADEIIFFDGKNGIAGTTDGLDKQYLYNIHTYVKLPQFTTPTEIVSMKILATEDEFGESNEMPLAYLAKKYNQFEDVFVPVMPGFQELEMVVTPWDDTKTLEEADERTIKMRVEDVPRDTGVKLVPAQHANSASFANLTANTRAEVSSTISFVAKETGTANVIIDIPVSGESKFTISESKTYSYRLHRGPSLEGCGGHHEPPISYCRGRYSSPATPSSTMWDAAENFEVNIKSAIMSGRLTSLDVVVHVLVNGELLKTEQLHAPKNISVNSAHGSRTAVATFDTGKIYKAVEFDANAGDFVEVVIDARIHADGLKGDSEFVGQKSSYTSNTMASCRCKAPQNYEVLVNTHVTRSAAFSSAELSIGPGVMFFSD